MPIPSDGINLAGADSFRLTRAQKRALRKVYLFGPIYPGAVFEAFRRLVITPQEGRP